MSQIEFYYNDLWSRVLKKLYETKQFGEDVIDLYIKGSKIINYDDKGIDIVASNFAGFSIMQNATTTFYIITPICLCIFGYLLYKTKKSEYLSKIALLLMIGGTIGNFIDRIVRIYVVDFLDFYIFGWDFPVFNFADMCLTVGVILYIIIVLTEKKDAKD